MIEPSKVEKEFKKVENRSYAFRRYLKIHGDPSKIDSQFSKLHEELFKDYDCSKCRNCCKVYSIAFEENEIEPAASELNITKEEFKDKYIKVTPNGYRVKEEPCCFLGKDNSCKIEKCKPENCRDYPFTNEPNRLFSLYSIIEFSSICPVVFEMIEKLKEMYSFK